jgi:hypothetical protein
MKMATIKLTAAIAIGGEIVRAGTVIDIGEDAAKDLLRRGKAEVATADDEPEADAEDDEPAAEKPKRTRAK